MYTATYTEIHGNIFGYVNSNLQQVSLLAAGVQLTKGKFRKTEEVSSILSSMFYFFISPEPKAHKVSLYS